MLQGAYVAEHADGGSRLICRHEIGAAVFEHAYARYPERGVGFMRRWREGKR